MRIVDGKYVLSGKYTPFIILSRQRVGSTLLQTYLKSHANVKVSGEIMSDAVSEPLIFSRLKRVYRPEGYMTQAKGFKLMYEHPWKGMDYYLSAYDYMRKVEGLRVIHVTRRNVFHTVVSREIGKRTDEWTTTKKKECDITFPIDVKYVEQIFFFTDFIYESIKKDFDESLVHSIVYEDFVNDIKGHLIEVCKFLGVNPVFPMKSDLVKQNHRAMREIVTNYDEIKDFFMDTKWGVYFDE